MAMRVSCFVETRHNIFTVKCNVLGGMAGENLQKSQLIAVSLVSYLHYTIENLVLAT